jgi:dTMP kinase
MTVLLKILLRNAMKSSQRFKVFIRRLQNFLVAHKFPGKFIVLEGIELNGKDTHTAALSKHFFFKNKEHSVILTREPTKLTEEGRLLRKMLLNMKQPQKENEKLFDLYLADRRKHVEGLIIPALKFGSTVISDRFKHSTIAYEGALGIPIERIINAHKGIIAPDLTIILDITIDEFKRRFAESAATHSEVFDTNVELMTKIREVYMRMPELLPDENIKFISSMEPFEQVHQKVVAEVEKIIS